MKLWIGLTDYDWFRFHASKERAEEINFWRPSPESTFKVLQSGELFLFKLHSPRNCIAGGFFIRFLQTPLSLAWRAFGEANGANSLQGLRDRISHYRARPVGTAEDPIIGCILLGEPFFLTQDEWIPSPPDFGRSIVQGKSYDLSGETGQRLWREVRARLERRAAKLPVGPAVGAVVGTRFGTPVVVTPRLGQGAFRLLVTEAYDWRCSMTRERTLPVLEAAHIHAYSRGGEHSLSNGVLLRSDLHRLFDLGYVTVDPQHHTAVVSRRIREEYENGRDYYALHGRSIMLPEDPASWPAAEYLRWHNDYVYRS